MGATPCRCSARSEGRIFIINELGENDGGLGAAEVDYLFGNPGDKPFVGDFDGRWRRYRGAAPRIHRASCTSATRHTPGVADSTFIFGDPGDRLVAGDWGAVGTGVDTPAVFRPGGTTFFFRHSNSQGVCRRPVHLGPTHLAPRRRYRST